MAHFDGERIVVRVVYDGAPLSGKTTSIRALAASLGGHVETPEEEGGRTVWFDWMEYQGGRCAGHPLHCQIVTVPGQQLAARLRTCLLDQADAVIFVADTTVDGMAGSEALLTTLRAYLLREESPASVIIQANKRDLDEIVPIDEVRERVGGNPEDVVETIAIDGSAIRQAFIRAIAKITRGLDESIVDTVEGSPELDLASGALLERMRRELAGETPDEVEVPLAPIVDVLSIADDAVPEARVVPAPLPPNAVPPRNGAAPKMPTLPRLGQTTDPDEIEIVFSPSVLRSETSR